MLASTPNPSILAQAVVFTATISFSGGTPPDGELITFKSGTTTLGTAPLSGGTASLTISTLPVGTSTIKASYAGDASYSASTSAGVKQVAKKYPTSVQLSSSLNPATYGQSVTLTATVGSTGPSTPTGTVTFKNGATNLGTVTLAAGVATLTNELGRPIGPPCLPPSYLMQHGLVAGVLSGHSVMKSNSLLNGGEDSDFALDGACVATPAGFFGTLLGDSVGCSHPNP